VGKSTLVNRMLGRREAIVAEQPGVTRDRKRVEIEWTGHTMVVVDTGGWMVGGDTLDAKVSGQAERAMAEADLVLLVVDVSVGVTDDDEAIAAIARRAGTPVVVVVNKCDDTSHDAHIWEFTRLGLGDPFALSALHGRNTGDLLDAVVAALPAPQEDETRDPDHGDDAEDGIPSVAVVGRPNVGKSTLFNRLVGDERSIVHDLPGTTRDSIDTIVETEEGPIRFVDTAGMRRRARRNEATERFSTVRALASVDRADAALLVIDSTVGVTHQDQRLAERVDASGCPIVVLLNKWEMLDAEARLDVMAQLGDRLRFLSYAPVLKISALTGKGVHELVPALGEAVDQYRTRVPTAELNRVIRDAQAAHPAPAGVRVLYATQGATDPPTITLFASRQLPRTYIRYLEGRIRDHFELDATPIKLRVRRRGE